MQSQTIAESVHLCHRAAQISAKESSQGKGVLPSVLAHWIQAFKICSTYLRQWVMHHRGRIQKEYFALIKSFTDPDLEAGWCIWLFSIKNFMFQGRSKAADSMTTQYILCCTAKRRAVTIRHLVVLCPSSSLHLTSKREVGKACHLKHTHCAL